MARQEETTELLAVWQEAKDTGYDPVRALLEGFLQRLLEEEITLRHTKRRGWWRPLRRSAPSCGTCRRTART